MSTLKVGEIKHENFTGTTQLKLDNSGNIGLGTSTPTSPDGSNADNSLNGPTLTIYGDSPAINLTSSTTGASDYSLINFGRTGSTSNPYRAVIGYKQSDDILRINAQNHIAFDAGGGINASEIMRIDGSGKVGIGTTSPDTILEVTDGGTEPRLVRIHNSSTNGSAIQFTNTDTGNSTNQGYFVGLGASGEANVWHQSNFNLLFGTNNIERMRIDSSGRLLLGTTTAGHADLDDLTIATSGNTGITIRSGTSNNGILGFADGTSGNAQYMGFVQYSHADNTMSFNTNDGERMRITSAGDLLMGTTSASAFDSFGGNTGGIILDNVDSANTLLLTTHDTSKCFFGVDANYSYIWNESNHPMRFATNNIERMRISNGGRVDIGDSLGTAHAGYFQVIHEGGNNQANDCLAYFESNANDWCIITNSNEGGNANHHHLYFYEEGTTRGSIGGSHGSNVNYNQGSDYRWKENIVDMTGAEGIEICKKLKPRKYNWIKNREGTGKINTVDGFIAHEVVEAGVLGAVTGEKDAVKEDGSIDGQLLDYGQMTPVLAAGIKGLIAKIEVLETKVAALEAT